jgi:phosphatidylglycerol---prolipoprotein diacylglyceryl transferase
MLPYFEHPVLELGPVPIYAFGVLVLIGILAGIELGKWRAPRHDIDPQRFVSFASWIIAVGFISSHVLDSLLYHPEDVLADPLILVDLRGGHSSFGGFFGALVTAVVWTRRKGESLLVYADLTLSVFPVAWIFGRAGCTLAHDHPGALTSSSNPLAFAYPGGPRWDLGFLEMLFAMLLALVATLLWRSKQPPGTYIALTCLAYAPVRFGLDFLRAGAAQGGDERYLGLTPAQWACFALFGAGLFALRSVIEERGVARRAPDVARERGRPA